MIRRVYAQGFKGLSFDQPLAPHSVMVGRVGSGKSSRALALVLAATGTLPGIARNTDILAAVGSGDSLVVGMELDDGTLLEREFKRKKGGTVTSYCRANGASMPKNMFEMEVERHGVWIADVASFLTLSDAKKIDELFRLFPPAGDVRGMNTSIARTKARISEIESSIKAKEQSCKSITESIAAMRLPTGTLPEIQAEIVKTEREYQQARDEITRERERIRFEQEAARQAAEAAQTQPETIVPPPRVPETETPAPSVDAGIVNGIAIAALERVLSALERARCEGCAAKMVLRRELKQLQAGA